MVTRCQTDLWLHLLKLLIIISGSGSISTHKWYWWSHPWNLSGVGGPVVKILSSKVVSMSSSHTSFKTNDLFFSQLTGKNVLPKNRSQAYLVLKYLPVKPWSRNLTYITVYLEDSYCRKQYWWKNYWAKICK